MKDLINYLKTIPENNDLGIRGFLGEELYEHRNKLNKLSFFKDKTINILKAPDYPKKTLFFLLEESHKYQLSDNIHLFAIYLIKDDKVVMNCSLDSFLDYEEEDYDYII